MVNGLTMHILCSWILFTVMQMRVLSYIVLSQWLNQLQNYSRQWIVTVVSEWDYNETTLTCWTTVLVLAGVQCISAWLSCRLETVTLCLQGTVVSHLKALDTDRRLFFLLPYFRFCTSVSILNLPIGLKTNSLHSSSDQIFACNLQTCQTIGHSLGKLGPVDILCIISY